MGYPVPLYLRLLGLAAEAEAAADARQREWLAAGAGLARAALHADPEAWAGVIRGLRGED